MIFDVVSFGWGIGLVLVGWVAGIAVGVVFTMIGKIGSLG